MTDLEKLVCSLASPDRSVMDVARIAGCDRAVVYRCIAAYGIVLKQRKKPTPRADSLQSKILALADGSLSSAEIAAQIGCSDKHVQNILRIAGAPRLPRGAQRGKANHFYKCGRIIDLDGYALVRAPANHPHARSTGYILEHRLILEQNLGRYLLPEEVVDHIDGLHLHNDPLNLRLFATNADHLRATIAAQRPNWSEEGFAKMSAAYSLRSSLPLVDTYGQRKARGDVRLLQILLAASRLGKDSPHLLGTLHHLEQAQIDCSSQTTIELALADLFPEFA